MRTRGLWSLGALAAVLAVGALFATIPPADAKDPETIESRGLASVRAAMKMLMSTQVGPVPGIPQDKALAMVRDWSPILTDFHMPLETSPYALGPDVRGLVRVFIGKKGADDLSIHLFVPGIPRARLREFVAKTGKELGYTETPLENAWTYAGSAAGQRELWVGVCDGLVSVESNPPP